MKSAVPRLKPHLRFTPLLTSHSPSRACYSPLRQRTYTPNRPIKRATTFLNIIEYRILKSLPASTEKVKDFFAQICNFSASDTLFFDPADGFLASQDALMTDVTTPLKRTYAPKPLSKKRLSNVFGVCTPSAIFFNLDRWLQATIGNSATKSVHRQSYEVRRLSLRSRHYRRLRCPFRAA